MNDLIPDKETLQALIEEVSIFRFALKKFPDIMIKEVKKCGCMGPLPECRCKKRERLLASFLNENRSKA